MTRIAMVSRLGSVTIPRELIVSLGLKPFDKIEVEVDDGRYGCGRHGRRSMTLPVASQRSA